MLTTKQNDLFYEPVYTIGHAASKLGIAVTTIRMYEHAGLILPYRTPTKRRLYSRRDLEHIQSIINFIRDEHLNLEAIRRLASLIPCWDMNKCPQEIHHHCPAFKDSIVPCWLIPDSECAKLDKDCRSCEVYLSCTQFIKNTKKILNKKRLDNDG
jgi:MerR family transcriptional regulator/heat shock protein HspR